MGLVLLIVLILLLVGAIPNIGPIPHQYGYFPSGVVGIILIVVLILLLTGRL